MNKHKLSKYIEPILGGLFILVIFNVIGNWFDSIYCNFNFEIFSSYITPSVTVITIYLGYKQYMDTKTSNETKELYQQDLNKLKLEEEIFYEYFSAITFFQGMISKTWMDYDQFIITQSENFFKLYSIGDKLDILTDFNSYDIDEKCFTCPYTYHYYADMMKLRVELNAVRYKIIDELQNNCNTIIEIRNRLSKSEISQKEFIDEFNSISKKINILINNEVKGQFFEIFKLYKLIEKQYIEEKFKSDYKKNLECINCPQSKVTYNDLQKIKNKFCERNKGE